MSTESVGVDTAHNAPRHGSSQKKPDIRYINGSKWFEIMSLINRFKALFIIDAPVMDVL